MPASPDSPTPDRDDRGRFAPGCSPGPGRPSRNTEATRLAAVFAAFGEEQITRTAATLFEISQDPKERTADRINAIRTLWQYVLPSPTTRAEISIGSGDSEFRIAGAMPSEVDARMLECCDRLLGEAGLLAPGALTEEDVTLHLGLTAQMLRTIDEQRQYDDRLVEKYNLEPPNNRPQVSTPFQQLIERRLRAESRLTTANLIDHKRTTLEPHS